MFAPGGNQPKILRQQLLATYFNLATRKINAATKIDSKLTKNLGLLNVRDAAVYAQATLALPVTNATKGRYSDATDVIDGINNNKIEKY